MKTKTLTPALLALTASIAFNNTSTVSGDWANGGPFDAQDSQDEKQMKLGSTLSASASFSESEACGAQVLCTGDESHPQFTVCVQGLASNWKEELGSELCDDKHTLTDTYCAVAEHYQGTEADVYGVTVAHPLACATPDQLARRRGFRRFDSSNDDRAGSGSTGHRRRKGRIGARKRRRVSKHVISAHRKYAAARRKSKKRGRSSSSSSSGRSQFSRRLESMPDPGAGPCPGTCHGGFTSGTCNMGPCTGPVENQGESRGEDTRGT